MRLADFYNNYYNIFIMLRLAPSVTPKTDQQQHHKWIQYSMLQYHLSLMRECTVMLDTRRDKVNGILL